MSIHLERKVLHWYKAFLNTKDKGRVYLWKEFVDMLISQFGEQVYSDPATEIKKLRQVGTLQQYLEEFDVLFSKSGLNEAQAVSHFLGGLREEIELSVRLFNPTKLQSAYALTKVQELLWVKRGVFESRGGNKDGSYVFHSSKVMFILLTIYFRIKFQEED